MTDNTEILVLDRKRLMEADTLLKIIEAIRASYSTCGCHNHKYTLSNNEAAKLIRKYIKINYGERHAV